jgi:WD40 repeat protein
MADVVCCVLDEGDRLRVTWSSGSATFPPYFVPWTSEREGEEIGRGLREALEQVLRQSTPHAALQLARAGHRLHQKLFLADAEQPAAVREIQQWWESQRELVTALAIVGSSPCSGYWHLVYDRPPSEQAFLQEIGTGECFKPFWGIRHPLRDGARVNPFAGRLSLVDPTVLLVEDDRIVEQERLRLASFADQHQLELAVSASGEFDLSARERPPDVLFKSLFGGKHDSQDYVTSQTVLFAREGSEEGHRAAVKAIQPVPATVARTIESEFLEGFLVRGEAVGALLQQLRARHAPLGLAYTSSCPPGLRVQRQAGTTPPPKPGSEEEPPLPDLPYRILRPCGPGDRALFTGRARESYDLSALVDGRSGLVLLHGPSGSGKTSLLRAGMLPFLEEECPGFWALRDVSEGAGGGEPLVFRCTGDLAGQLAAALVRFCARPIEYETPAGQTVAWDGPEMLAKFLRTTDPADRILELREALQAEPQLLQRVLRTLSAELPWHLLVVVDQGEDLVTLQEKSQTSAPMDLELLESVVGEANCTVVLSIRSEAFGAVLDSLGPAARKRVVTYHLPELDEERLVEMILWPTATEPVPYASDVPNAAYDFLFEEGLAEKIARDALVKTRGQGETLPLIQLLCCRLYQRLAGRAERVIREEDLKKLGGVEPGFSKYLESTVKRELSRGERKAIVELLERLYRRRADGTRFGVPRTWKDLEVAWDKAVLRGGGRPLEEVVQGLTFEESRLLRPETLGVGGKEKEYLSIAHDALGEAVDQAAEQRRTQAYGRSRIVDTLWVMIPFTVLVASIIFTLTTRFYSARAQENEKSGESLREEATTLANLLEINRYQANISLADQALRGGNALRAHQALKETLSQYLQGQEIAPSPLARLRGFEWYYLWQQVHPERLTIPGFIGTFPCIDLSADGKTLAVGGACPAPPGQDKLGTVKLYDAVSGAFREELRTQPGPVLALALSPDGRFVASADEQGAIQVWGTPEKAVRKVLRGHEGAIRALAFSPDGQTLASGGDDDKVMLWDVSNGKQRAVLSEHSGKVQAVAFAPKGPVFASAGTDQSVILWDAAAGKKLRVLKEHSGAVHALAFSRDGKRLVSGGARRDGSFDQGEVRLWDVAKGETIPSPGLRPPEVFTLAFGEDDKTIFVGGKDNGVWLWDMAATEAKAYRPTHFGWVRQLLLSPDGKTLITASFDRTVKVWDVHPPTTRLRGSGADVLSVTFSADGKTMASSGRDGNAYVWDTRAEKPRQTLSQPKTSVGGVVFSTDAKYAVTAGWDKEKNESNLTLWNVSEGKALKSLRAHSGAVTCLALARDGKTLASGGTDRRVKLWRWDGEKAALDESRTMEGHTGAVRCLAFSADGDWLASGGDDKAVWLWDPSTGKKKHEPRRHHTGSVTSLAFTGGGKSPVMLATGGTDRTVWIFWVPERPDKSWTWRGLAGDVRALTYSPDGRTLAVAGSDRCVTLWDVDTDVPRLTLTGHTQPVSSLAFAPDGRTLISGSLDGDVRIWRGAAK